MVDEPEVTAACAEAAASCEPLFWGRRLAGVAVELKTVPTPLLERAAHRGVAPQGASGSRSGLRRDRPLRVTGARGAARMVAWRKQL